MYKHDRNQSVNYFTFKNGDIASLLLITSILMRKTSAECVDLVCDQVYNVYPVCDIDRYNFELDYDNTTQNYNHYVIFELGTQYKEYHLFNDSMQNVDDYVNITFINSTISEMPANDECYWCRACVTGYEPKHGDTCWYDIYFHVEI